MAQMQTKTNRPQQPSAGKAVQQVVDSIIDAVQDDRLVDAARAGIHLGKELTRAQKSIHKIDGAMKDLDQQIPGIPNAVSEVATAFNDLAQKIPARSAPSGLKPLAKDLKAAVDTFSQFSKDYDAYTKAPASSWLSPSTWGAKANAGLQAQKSWSNFMKSYSQLQTHLPKQLQNSQLQDAARRTAEGLLDAADELLK